MRIETWVVLPLDCVAKAPWILSSARLLAFPSSICYFRLIFFLLHVFQLAVVVLVTLAVIAHTLNLFSFVDLMMHRLFVVPFAICLFFFMHHSTIFLKRKFTFNKWVERSSTFKWKRIEKLKFLSCGCRFFVLLFELIDYIRAGKCKPFCPPTKAPPIQRSSSSAQHAQKLHRT